MAQLYFHYSAMNAGKSTSLLQSAHNYKERGMFPMLMTAEFHSRGSEGVIESKIGIDSEALIFNADTDIRATLESQLADGGVDCILIDEAQFLTKTQVEQLTYIVDKIEIPVMCFGLRTDYRGELFEGAKYLLAWADKLVELKTVCFCGRKATMVIRYNEDGSHPITQGDDAVLVDGPTKYESVCRKHYHEFINKTKSDQAADHSAGSNR
ncbi:thymidine kinase [Ferrimonas marina]|uniref:Thymidine kinase n=1 Tax=Ferrimonas marina TaxID=299255 RepID=A0A1M5T6W6_9GAMM|nr:thymidine kinase [Ferrimonas marina]SHH46350.1 thymidine kinase [Ferrimonas marina]